MFSKQLNLDPDIIRDCIEALGEPVSDRNEFIRSLITQRLMTINKRHSEEFDRLLYEATKSLNERPNIRETNRVVRRLNRLSKRITRNEFALLKCLHKLSKNQSR